MLLMTVEQIRKRPPCSQLLSDRYGILMTLEQIRKNFSKKPLLLYLPSDNCMILMTVEQHCYLPGTKFNLEEKGINVDGENVFVQRLPMM